MLSCHTGFWCNFLRGSRTPDRLVRSQVLYPAELPARVLMWRILPLFAQLVNKQIQLFLIFFLAIL